MFKVAALAGIHTAKAKVAEWTDDEKMDLALALGLPGLTGVPLAQQIASGATAPGGHYIQGPLREMGRGMLEGVGGAAAGGLSSAALAALLSRKPELIQAAGMIGAGLGGAAGAAHGQYASRRNQRAETGDYHWLGHNRGKADDAK